MITVKKENDNKFLVTVEEGGSSTEHAVNLDDEYYRDLTGGEIAREELIRKSFKFLLEREPKESILPQFNLGIYILINTKLIYNKC
ncbi:MAG: hypothetical protein U9O59_02300 [Actinomycetota bacterium]|nr:hypothetical protein [Actinomycetota bacterium]